MKTIKITHPSKEICGKISLAGSKSISNRALIIRALAGESFDIHRLSNSDDTSTLERLLSKRIEVYDTHHAGTTYRFLTSFLAIQPGTQILTGSDRMKERPIGPLVDALRDLGARIEYTGRQGYPPLKIHDFDAINYQKSISVRGDISSQYITSLLLIAPSLPSGLELVIDGELVSKPYLDMTLTMLREFGINHEIYENKIVVARQPYSSKAYHIEADWSACSYYFSIAALAESAEIQLSGLFENSMQGDSKIMDIASHYGIESTFDDQGILHIKKAKKYKSEMSYDFINQPDLAQTIAVISAGLGVKSLFRGMKTLRIKETDRIAALQSELQKVNSDMPLSNKTPNDEIYGIESKIRFDSIPRFSTYKDHRMAMAFAPLALLHPIEIGRARCGKQVLSNVLGRPKKSWF